MSERKPELLSTILLAVMALFFFMAVAEIQSMGEEFNIPTPPETQILDAACRNLGHSSRFPTTLTDKTFRCLDKNDGRVYEYAKGEDGIPDIISASAHEITIENFNREFSEDGYRLESHWCVRRSHCDNMSISYLATAEECAVWEDPCWRRQPIYLFNSSW